jgi:predicted transcriptional regulator
LLRDVVERVFGGSRRDLVGALLDEEDVTPEILAELRTLIAQKEAEGDAK